MFMYIYTQAHTHTQTHTVFMIIKGWQNNAEITFSWRKLTMDMFSKPFEYHLPQNSTSLKIVRLTLKSL